jgi:hypothetical protein
MMKALMNFTFVEDSVWKSNWEHVQSIRDFQCNFIYHSMRKIIEKSSDGLTTSGFEKLEKGVYLFVSNHRYSVRYYFIEYGFIWTWYGYDCSAIGDNLVKKDFLNVLAKMNRNFLVRRGLTPREMLENIIGIYWSFIVRESRSVWICNEKEGLRTEWCDESRRIENGRNGL